MQFSDLEKHNRIQTHREASEYENTRISNVCVKPEIDLDATDLQETGNNYEQLRLETKQNDGRNVKGENKSDTIRWKDQPKEIKYIIYTLSVMLVILYIIVITAVIVLYLPKGETDGIWTHWSPWSNCDVTCNNGTQTRTRLCTNPAKSNEDPDCFGDSTDKRHCQQQSCPDGIWTHWSPWSNCDVTCNIGTQTRTRLCTNPSKSNEDPDCFGVSAVTRHCQQQLCNDYGVAFTADDLDTESERVFRFQRTNFNKGGAYNSSSGIFTCRIPGVYYFAVTLPKIRTDKVQMAIVLVVKGTNTLYMHRRAHGNNGIAAISASGTYHLNIYDTVYIKDYGVAFTAIDLDTTGGDSNRVFRFQDTDLNKGGAYNITSGIFTCRIPGVYYFAVTLPDIRADIVQMAIVLVVKGTNTLHMHRRSHGNNGIAAISASGTYHLNINDTVYLHGRTSYFISGAHSYFTGFLVLPDV